MGELDNIVKEFLAESHENLEHLDRDLVALEKAPQDSERLANIFRTIHTIKGTCGFFNFTRLGALTHAGESLLGQIRDGKLLLSPSVISALLALGDAVRATLGRIETTGQEGDEEHLPLIAELEGLQPGAPGPTTAPVHNPPAAAPDLLPGGAADSAIRVDVGLLGRLMRLVGELVLTRNQLLQLSVTHESPPCSASRSG